jgi:hypothetical protein
LGCLDMKPLRTHVEPVRVPLSSVLRVAFLGAAALSVESASLGCATLQSAAAQDPMKCEQDPKCQSHQGKSADCVTVCVDDPACIERCREVSGRRW